MEIQELMREACNKVSKLAHQRRHAGNLEDAAALEVVAMAIARLSNTLMRLEDGNHMPTVLDNAHDSRPG